MVHFVTYCVECEWFASTEDHTRSEQSDLAIDHYLTTGHAIESDRRSVTESTTGWADEWPPSG